MGKPSAETVEFKAVFPELKFKDKLIEPQSGRSCEVALFSLEIPTTGKEMRDRLAEFRNKSIKVTFKLEQGELEI